MEIPVWMSHGDRIDEPAEGVLFHRAVGSSRWPRCRITRGRSSACSSTPRWCTPRAGTEILANFLFRVCGLSPDWTMHSFVESSVKKIRGRRGRRGSFSGSPGVDSSVAAVLLHRAIGDRLTCIFVDNGLLRGGEAEEVVRTFRDAIGLRLDFVDASARFLEALAGVEDPERKRKIIGGSSCASSRRRPGRSRASASSRRGPSTRRDRDVSFKSPSAVIKSHHNVGGCRKGCI